jgi:hydrogenase/urease accessory protein HupE
MKRGIVLAAFALANAFPVHAHELGKTQVAAAFRSDRAYQIDVTIDPDATLTRLEVFGGLAISANVKRDDRDRRIEALAQVFLDRVRVSFDGVDDRPRFEYVRASAFNDFAQTPSIIRLTGRVPDGAEAVVFVDGLAMGSYALNVRIGDSPVHTVWLEGPAPSAPISLVAARPPATRADVARQYFVLGYTHILPKGSDHILFVVGIFLLSARWRSILVQVSTFTLAHSITLGLTMYGIVSLPARVVEPMIALSIAYVAVENLFTTELKSWRLALVFSFGLLHGMGFAGVLRELGLPRSEFLTALVTFNAGVEAGQLTVIALAFAAVANWRSNGLSYRRFVVQPASFMIALAGLYWTVQRALFN